MSSERTLRATIQLVDNFTRPVQQVVQQTEALRRSSADIENIDINAIDNASRIIDTVEENLDSLRSEDNIEAVVGVDDQATTTLENIQAEIDVLKRYKPIKIIINAVEKVSSIIRNIMNKLTFFNKPIELILKMKDFVSSKIENVKNKITSIYNRVKAPLLMKLKLVTNVIKEANNISKSLKKIISLSTKPLILKAKDMASKVINKVTSTANKFKNLKSIQLVLKAKDIALNVINKVLGKAKGIAGKVFKFTISALDKASGVLSSIMGKVKSLAKGVTVAITTVGGLGIKELGSEETQKITINRVIQNGGSTKKEAEKVGAEYYKYLEEYANKTPFTNATLADWGTKAMLISKGDVDSAKQYTDAMANIKAFVGDMRTEQEVSEAMFSASTGNLESLNNMLGTSYSTFDEAMEGIRKNQGGLVEEMSTTIPGLLSTITGKMGKGFKEAVRPFTEVLKGSLSNVISMIDEIIPKAQQFSEMIATVMGGGSVAVDTFTGKLATIIGQVPAVIQSLGEMFNKFIDFSSVQSVIDPIINGVLGLFDGIINKSPTTMGFMEVLGTVFNTVFEMIGTVIETVSPVIQGIFDFIGKHSQEISAFIQILGSIWDTVWNAISAVIDAVSPIIEEIFLFIISNGETIQKVIETLGKIWDSVWKLVGPLLKAAWAICEPILQALVDAIDVICDAVQSVCDWWDKMVGLLSKPVNAVVNITKKMFGKDKDGSHAFGAKRIPYDGYMAELHQGERVLTANETRQMDKQGGLGSGININKLADTMVIREEADMDKFINKLVDRLEFERKNYGGAF